MRTPSRERYLYEWLQISSEEVQTLLRAYRFDWDSLRRRVSSLAPRYPFKIVSTPNHIAWMSEDHICYSFPPEFAQYPVWGKPKWPGDLVRLLRRVVAKGERPFTKLPEGIYLILEPEDPLWDRVLSDPSLEEFEIVYPSYQIARPLDAPRIESSFSQWEKELRKIESPKELPGLVRVFYYRALRKIERQGHFRVFFPGEPVPAPPNRIPASDFKFSWLIAGPRILLYFPLRGMLKLGEVSPELFLLQFVTKFFCTPNFP